MTSRVKLGTVCHVVTKGTTPTSIGLPFSDDGVPFLRIQNLSNKSVKLENVLYVSENTQKILARSIIKPKDFLITIAGTIGKVAIVPSDFPECNCNQAIAILRFDYKKLNPQYLLHWLGTSDALGQITGRKVTATISNLSLGQIKELEIPLPPLAEQQKIAAILDAADSLRQKDQQLVERYTTLSQSLFLAMFGDPETSRFEKNTLQNLFSKGEYGAGATAIEYNPNTPRYIRITDIDDEGHLKEKRVSADISNMDAAKYKLRDGDLVFARSGATVGKTYLYNENDGDLIYAGYLIKFGIKKPFEAKYFFYFTKTQYYKKWIEKIQTVVAQPNVNAKQYGQDLLIPIPPIALQNQFAESIKLIEAQKQQAQASLQKSEALFNSLLQQAFTGELTRPPMERAA